VDHRAELYRREDSRVERIKEAILIPPKNGLDGPITPSEVNAVLEKSKKSTAPGSDAVPTIIWAKLNTANRATLTTLLSDVLVNTNIPASWKRGDIVPIPKAGSKELRPITLLQSIGKVLERVVLARMIHAQELAKAHFPDEMYGFRRRQSTQQCVLSLLERILWA